MDQRGYRPGPRELHLDLSPWGHCRLQQPLHWRSLWQLREPWRPPHSELESTAQM